MGKTFDKGLFTKNLEVMRSVFFFEYNSMRAVDAILATAEGCLLEEEQVRAMRKFLRSEHGVFSYFRGHLELPIVVKMAMAKDPGEYLKGVDDTYKQLSASFLLGDESRLLAAIILYENISPEARGTMCARTMEVYRAMKENHPLITTQGDLPFAVLIAAREEEVDDQLREAESCYQAVKERFIFSGNQVQTVSHILAIGKGDAEEKSARFLALREAFKENGMRLYSEYMAILAVLANAPISVEEAVQEAKDNESFLRTQKGFGILGTGTSMRRMFAAAITALSHTQEMAEAYGAMSGTVLAIILDIELMIVMMAAASAASSSSSSSH